MRVQVVVKLCDWPSHSGMMPLAQQGVSGLGSSRSHIYVSDMAA